LLELIESLLQYVRIESGRLELRRERVDLLGLAADVVEEVRPQAQQKPLELRLDMPAELPPLHSDPRIIRMVLLNLAVNAVKYTEKGTIDVRIAYGAGAHRMEVADTGHGIAADDLQRIFEPFTQLGDVRHKHVAGVGLGLALVKQLVAALGGSIAVS